MWRSGFGQTLHSDLQGVFYSQYFPKTVPPSIFLCVFASLNFKGMNGSRYYCMHEDIISHRRLPSL